jgi:tyrosine decarboxylase
MKRIYKFSVIFCSESSWISWPLAFLFNSSNSEDSTTLRFRHLDVRMGSSRRNSASGGGSSPSPESENGNALLLQKSPRRSPQPMRKRGTSPNVGKTNGNP